MLTRRRALWALPLLLLAVMMAAALFALTPAQPAGAQQATQTFVANTGQADGTDAFLGNDYAQAFTTGSNAAGYSLRSVDVEFAVIDSTFSSSSLTASIHADSGGSPGNSLGTLTNPASFPVSSSDQTLTFTSSAGIDLAANTTYFVMFDMGSNQAQASIRATASDSEDSGALAGWSIGDSTLRRGFASTGTWTTEGASLKLSLGGVSKPSLVSNFGQANGGTGNFVQHDHAQAFTTGANAGGYTLTGVDFSFPQINDGALAGKLTAEIRSDSSGAPGAVVATLTKPGTIAAGTNSFTHSGVALAANTTYWAVLDVTLVLLPGANTIRNTASDAEDAGGADGWTIADDGHYRTWNTSGAWTSFSQSRKMTIHGTAVETVATETFVANTGQADGGTSFLGNDFHQAFTTGGSSFGYTLHSVDVEFSTIDSAFSSSALTASIHTASGGSPGSSLGTLTNPASFPASTSDQTLTFTSSAGIDLEGSATYFLVIDMDAGQSSSRVRLTGSDAEDSGGLAGWSIADGAGTRTASSTGAWTPNVSSLKISLDGVSKPRPSRVSILGGGDPPPGPCETGYVAPTPVVVAVSEVPIVVSSTTADYFVLYVERPNRDNPRQYIPVSVTRGQAGTTTLKDNLAALSPTKYRVEKYQVAQPGDLDGDCVDDITELDDLGDQNPINPTRTTTNVQVKAALDSHETFQAFSDQQDFGTNAFEVLDGLEHVKFMILGEFGTNPSIYFIDSTSPKWHLALLRELRELGEPEGHLLVAMKGNLVYHPNVIAPDGSLGMYRFSYNIGTGGFSRTVNLHQLLASAMPFLENNLAYYPQTERELLYYGREKAQYDTSRVNIILQDDILPDVAYIPLNQAEGYGRLRLMAEGDDPRPGDIAIYESLPNDLPRVAGTITTVPQTPLSHVNLRAIQNGVPNAFLRDILTTREYAELIGKHVYFAVAADGFTLREATKSEVDRHHQSARPTTTQTLTRDLSVTTITSLANVAFADWDAFGVKAANMAELSKLNLPAGTVPTGYAVPFYFYDEFMKANGFYDDIDTMLADPNFQSDYAVQESMLKALRKKIKKGTTPAWIIKALEEMHAAYPDGTSLRYRSSTNNEDLPAFNGAGLYSSKTQDPDETAADGIDKSIKAVWASLWNYRAFLERDYYRVDHKSVAMGVLVHPNYSDEQANGVAVSHDPISFSPNVYYVNTQLGEDLVTNPEARSYPEQLLLDANGKASVLARSNHAPPGQLLMSDAQLLQLRRHLEVIHNRFKQLYQVKDGDQFAIEIEFKITAENTLAIKQARPWVFAETISLKGAKPEVSITAGGDVTEGEAATFTLTANPAPTDSIAVRLTVSGDEDYIYGRDLGQRTVIIPAGVATVTVRIGTSVDSLDEAADGHVIATLDTPLADAGYTLSDTASSASITVADDDNIESVAYMVAPTVIANVKSYAAESQHGADHVNRWRRVLVAFGELDPSGVTGGAMTSAEAQRMAGLYDPNRWNPVVAELTALEAGTVKPVTIYILLLSDQLTEGGPLVGGPGLGSQAMLRIALSRELLAGETVVVPFKVEGDADAWSLSDPTDPIATFGARSSITFDESDGHLITLFLLASDDTDSDNETITIDFDSARPPTLNGSSTGVTLGKNSGFDGVETTATRLVIIDDDPVVEEQTGHTVDPDVVASVRALAAQTQHGTAHVNRWNRVLVAFGEHDGTGVTGGAMTAAQAQQMADTYSSPVWDEVVTELTALEAASTQTPPPPTPEVSVTAGGGVTEGGSAVFTLTASPAPSSNLDVSVTVSQSGDYGATTGQRTVTVPTTGSVTLTVGTTDDTTDETDGSVTATVNAGSGYTVSSTQGAATVAVADNDAAPTPEVSVTAGSGVTEGGDATFTVTASPAPASNLAVSVTVSQSGDYGAATGQRTVTVPTTGSVTLTVGTTDDTTDETDGSVTATVNAGSGYTVSSTQGAATVAVADNDDAPTPVVSVTAGSGVTEGGDAVFTVTASPAPAADLAVSVTVSQSGDYGATTGQRTVTVPTSGSVTLTVGTTDDTTDETDGSVTATVDAGSGYTVSSTQGAATVGVADNDDAPTPEVSVDRGRGRRLHGDGQPGAGGGPGGERDGVAERRLRRDHGPADGDRPDFGQRHPHRGHHRRQRRRDRRVGDGDGGRGQRLHGVLDPGRGHGRRGRQRRRPHAGGERHRGQRGDRGRGRRLHGDGQPGAGGGPGGERDGVAERRLRRDHGPADGDRPDFGQRHPHRGHHRRQRRRDRRVGDGDGGRGQRLHGVLVPGRGHGRRLG